MSSGFVSADLDTSLFFLEDESTLLILESESLSLPDFLLDLLEPRELDLLELLPLDFFDPLLLTDFFELLELPDLTERLSSLSEPCDFPRTCFGLPGLLVLRFGSSNSVLKLAGELPLELAADFVPSFLAGLDKPETLEWGLEVLWYEPTDFGVCGLLVGCRRVEVRNSSSDDAELDLLLLDRPLGDLRSLGLRGLLGPLIALLSGDCDLVFGEIDLE